MKRKVVSLLIVILLFTSFNNISMAQETINFDGFEFDMGTGTVISYTGDKLTLEIPKTIEGVSVIKIADSAFFMWKGKEIVIPNCIIDISETAFTDCINLKAIEVAEGNEYYLSYEGVLFNKDRSVLVIYPEDKDGEVYHIPEGVVEISSNAFYSYKNLKGINIPSTTKIEDGCFGSIFNLEEITVDEDNPYIASVEGVLFNKDITKILQYPRGKSDTQYSIPDGVTSIGELSFFATRNLELIDIPDSVEEIEDYAFYASGIVEIDIPDNVKVFQEGVFSNTSITNLIISEYVLGIEKEAFSGCSKLVNISIPNNVLSIGEYCFDACISLHKIELPEGIDNIEAGMFKDCWNLSDVILPSGIKTIGEEAFMGSGIVSIIIPDNVACIGDMAFAYCNNLEEVIIPEGVIEIGNEMFSNNYNLKKITIPNSVVSISKNAFAKRNGDLTIYGGSGSVAEEYADKYFINYLCLSDGVVENKEGRSTTQEDGNVKDDKKPRSFYLIIAIVILIVLLIFLLLRKKE